MKISKPAIYLALTLMIATKITYGQEEEDDEIEIDDEALDAEIIDEMNAEQEAISEELQKEIASGIVDTTKYPGRIISRKKVVSKVPAAGQPLEFEYTIWNVGNSDVSDVELVDDSFSSEFFESFSKVEFKVDTLAPGAKISEVHSVVPKMPENDSNLKVSGARVTYKTKTSNDNEELIQYTADGSSDGIVPIKSAAYYARNVASHYLDWFVFLMLAIPSTLLPYTNANASVSRYLKVKSA